jgi:2,4-diaminopentanoate dehydrogenase
MKKNPPKLLQMGLGPLGQKTVRFAVERGFRFVAAVDPDPDKCGRDLGELCGVKRLGVRIEPSVELALKKARLKPDVAILTTVSSLARLAPQV